MGSAFTKFIPTIETIRLGYIVETHIVARNNLMLIGPTGCGKSWLSRDILFKQIPLISNKYKSYSMVYSNGTTAEKAQIFIDSRLEKRRKGVYGPPLSQKYVFFIDDLMMPF
jgi:dynein heavy chain, axonemal